MRKEFFVGYQRTMPASIAAFVRSRVAALFLLTAVLATILVTAQKGFSPGVFEFGHTRAFEGVLSENPYPSLLVVRPGVDNPADLFSRYLLVAPGKHGAAEILREHQGRRVQLQGTLVYRDGRTMIEVVPGSLQTVGSGDSHPQSPVEDLGTHTLVGEIVDSKCYLGVMKPGNLKTHRSCAIRCISGGIPPVLLVRDREGSALYFLITGADGRMLNQEVLDLVADPIEVTGRVERHNDALILRAEPKTFRRIRAASGGDTFLVDRRLRTQHEVGAQAE